MRVLEHGNYEPMMRQDSESYVDGGPISNPPDYLIQFAFHRLVRALRDGSDRHETGVPLHPIV